MVEGEGDSSEVNFLAADLRRFFMIVEKCVIKRIKNQRKSAAKKITNRI